MISSASSLLFANHHKQCKAEYFRKGRPVSPPHRMINSQNEKPSVAGVMKIHHYLTKDR
jgi:hypothetical protein